MPHHKSTLISRRRPHWLGFVSLGIVLLYLGTGTFHLYKPLPEGVNIAGPYRPAGQVEFLVDSTWLDQAGRQHNEQEIFDAAFNMIDRAQSFVVVDFFLVNHFAGNDGDGHRQLSRELIDRMVQRRQDQPGLYALLVTDPFNTLYNGVSQPLFEGLESVGIDVVETDLTRLRDSNPAWSATWRICCQWFGNSPGKGWLPNPVGDTPIGLRTYLSLSNFKANHRKTVVVDTQEGWTGLVTSANPHDASSRHHNIAVKFTGPAALDLLSSELSVARFSGHSQRLAPDPDGDLEHDPEAEIRVLTESRIRDAALDMIDSAGPGDRLDLLMFYLSHRNIIAALERAHERGAELRILLDPNEDAFGRKKNGIPNRQAAMELHRSGIPVRWCNTRGEQCHAKMLLKQDRDNEALLLAGSANFTRRNLDNFNLETNVQVRANRDSAVMEKAATFFDTRWHNQADSIHSLPYSAFADDSRLRYWRYRFMEATGLSTF